ncbi:MAG: hypothetical protein JXQ23_05230 [Clostridia bacterium]|nr:hypothetical protein [Clostridia bacterium]
MLRRLKNNLGYKIVAFLLAVLFWVVVYNNDNPVNVERLPIPITFTNQTYPTTNNLRILNDYDKSVTIEIRGRNDELSQVSASDFVIIYDFSEINSANVSSITYSSVKYLGDKAIDYKVINEGKINLDVERIMTTENKIAVELTGEPAFGYSIVSRTITPENFTIKDVSSLVSKVATAIVRVDIEGIKGDKNVRRFCEFYDQQGNIINELNAYLAVDISIEVAREFDVETTIYGVPDPDYQVISKDPQPSKVKISGPESALASIDVLKTESVSVSGANQDSIVKAALINVPIGCKVVSGINEVSIAIRVEKLEERIFDFTSSEIDIKYKDSNNAYSYFILDPGVSITLKGRTEILDQINKADLSPSIDVRSQKDTVTFLPVEISIPAEQAQDIKQVSFISVEVKIVKNMTITIPTSEITLINQRNDLYTYSYPRVQTSLIVSGFSEDLADVSVSTLNPTINVKDLTEGTHRIKLNYTIPANTEVFNSVLVDVIIKAK